MTNHRINRHIHRSIAEFEMCRPRLPWRKRKNHGRCKIYPSTEMLGGRQAGVSRDGVVFYLVFVCVCECLCVLLFSLSLSLSHSLSRVSFVVGAASTMVGRRPRRANDSDHQLQPPPTCPTVRIRRISAPLFLQTVIRPSTQGRRANKGSCAPNSL